MAPRARLAANLPATPLTREQRKLFDANLQLAEYMAGIGARKYGAAMADVARCSALTGLMCAASRYQTPSAASFRTFAIHTINWTMRLDVRRELGQKPQDPERRREYIRSRNPGRKAHELFEPSAYRASGDMPDVVFGKVEYGSEFATLVDRSDPESQLVEAERLAEVKRVVEAALAVNPPRSVAMLMRNMDGETLSRISVDYCLSRERVRQLVTKAIAKVGELVRDVA